MPEEPLGIRSRLAPPGGELGAIHWESIEIMGDRLDNLRVEWSPAALPISARRFEHLADTLSAGPDEPFNIRFMAPCGEIPCRRRTGPVFIRKSGFLFPSPRGNQGEHNQVLSR